MAGMEDKPLLAEPQIEETDDIPSHPPPPYLPVNIEVEMERPVAIEVPTVQPQAKKYTTPTDRAMPLPTYAQSEKYETEGVLEFNQKDTDGEETEDELPRSESETVGTWCEFFLFFLICSMFSILGFLISICVATTVAAKGGAVAGLGIALASKPIMFELYDDSFVRNYCSSDTSDDCFNRFYTVIRFCIWIIGLFGLYLLLKGTTVFIKAKKQQTTR